VKILVSARDTGAARHFAEIVPYLRSVPGVTVDLVADQLAWGVLDAAGLAPLQFCEPAIEDAGSARADALRGAARDLLAASRPDAVLVGLSGPRIGLDEALLAESGATPTYALQDYPGWIVEGFGVPARTYFVLDETAATLTTGRLGQARIVIAGSAKHATYNSLDVTALRRRARATYDSKLPVISFYGQPAWFLRGYDRCIDTLAAAIALAAPASQVVYRPHPKETAAEHDRMRHIFAAYRIDLRPDPNETAEASLCAADLVITCFSSCGADHIHLQRQAALPIGTVLYLATEPDIRQHHAIDTGVEYPPFATAGFALLSTSAETVADDISRGIDPATAKLLWRQIRTRLPSPIAAADVILSTIRADHVDRAKPAHV
jgi:hypothetical protein